MKKTALAIGISMLSMICCAANYHDDRITRHSAKIESSSKLIGYLSGWNTPPAANDLAQAGYTDVIVAYGVFSTITPGQIMPAFPGISPDYIQSLHAAGLKVLLALGGPSTSIANATTDFHSVLRNVSDSRCFAEEFLSSMETLLTQYGFDGFDIHIEHGLIG